MNMKNLKIPKKKKKKHFLFDGARGAEKDETQAGPQAGEV